MRSMMLESDRNRVRVQANMIVGPQAGLGGLSASCTDYNQYLIPNT